MVTTGLARYAWRGGAARQWLSIAGVAAGGLDRAGRRLLAPFGGFSFNLAAITAAIYMRPDADPTQPALSGADLGGLVIPLAAGM